MIKDLSRVLDSLDSLIGCDKKYQQKLASFLEYDILNSSEYIEIISSNEFTRIIQHIYMQMAMFEPLEKAECPFSPFILKLYEYVYSLSIQNPNIHQMLSFYAPYDEILMKYFGSLRINFKKCLITVKNGETFFKMLAALLFSTNCSTLSSLSIELIVLIIEYHFSKNLFHEFILSILCGMIYYLPSSLNNSFLVLKFSVFKPALINLLSSLNANLSIQSLYILMHCYPSQINISTATKIALATLDSKDSSLFSHYVSCWIIQKMYSQLIIEDIYKLFSFSFKGGYIAYLIFQMLDTFESIYSKVIMVIQTNNLFIDFIDFLLDSKHQYVSYMGLCMFNNVFSYCNNRFIDADVSNVFSKALRLVLNNDSMIHLKQKEIGLLIIRLLARYSNNIEMISKSIAEIETHFLTEFKRQIEENNAFISLQFFLCLCECCKLDQNIKQRLKQFVINSQLPFLIINVLQNSPNRKAVEDSILALMIINSGFSFYSENLKTPYYFGIESSHTLSNQMRKKADRDNDMLLSQKNHVFNDEMSKLITEMQEAEFLFATQDKNPQIFNEEEAFEKQIKLEEMNLKLSNEIYKFNQRIEKYKKSFYLAKAELQVMKEKYAELTKILSKSSSKGFSVRSKEISVVKLKKDCISINRLNSTLEIRNKEIRKEIDNHKSLNEKNSSLIQQFNDKNHKLNVMNSQNGFTTDTRIKNLNEISKSINRLKKYNSALKGTYQTIINQGNDLSKSLNHNQKDLLALMAETEHYKDLKKQLSERIDTITSEMIEMDNKENDKAMILRLINNYTEKGPISRRTTTLI